MKKKLSLNLKHPGQKFNLGGLKVTRTPTVFDLTEAQVSELNTAGPQKWVTVHEQKKSKGAKRAE